MNKIVVVGYVVRDPELREVSGVSCLNFTIAAYSKTKNAEGKYITNFYSCTAWRGLADMMGKYVKKGTKLAVSGDLTLRPYVNSDGAEKLSVQITVSDMDFASKSESSGDNHSANSNPLPF